MILEGPMRRTAASTRVRPLVRRLAPLACVAILGVTAAACGSDNKPDNTGPAVTTTPSGATTPATTTAPKSGGAGF